jgi:hypothetical protein
MSNILELNGIQHDIVFAVGDLMDPDDGLAQRAFGQWEAIAG